MLPPLKTSCKLPQAFTLSHARATDTLTLCINQLVVHFTRMVKLISLYQEAAQILFCFVSRNKNYEESYVHFEFQVNNLWANFAEIWPNCSQIGNLKIRVCNFWIIVSFKSYGCFSIGNAIYFTPVTLIACKKGTKYSYRKSQSDMVFDMNVWRRHCSNNCFVPISFGTRGGLILWSRVLLKKLSIFALKCYSYKKKLFIDVN